MRQIINFKTDIFYVPSGIKFKVPDDKCFETSNIYSLFGINGIGKTTFLNQLIRELRKGGELFDASFLSSPNMAIIPQKIEDLLCPWLTPSKIIKVFSGNFSSNKEFDFHDLNMNVHFRKLSGGEKQRFAIELVTSFDFDLLFLDEPFSSLDLANIKYCSKLIKDYVTNHSCILFIILHDFKSLQYLSDYILFFNQQKGEIYLEPNLYKSGEDNSFEIVQEPNFIKLCYDKSL